MIGVYEVTNCEPIVKKNRDFVVLSYRLKIRIKDIFGNPEEIILKNADLDQRYHDNPLIEGNQIVAGKDGEVIVGIRKYWEDASADKRENRRSELIFGREILPEPEQRPLPT